MYGPAGSMCTALPPTRPPTHLPLGGEDAAAGQNQQQVLGGFWHRLLYCLMPHRHAVLWKAGSSKKDSQEGASAAAAAVALKGQTLRMSSAASVHRMTKSGAHALHDKERGACIHCHSTRAGMRLLHRPAAPAAPPARGRKSRGPPAPPRCTAGQVRAVQVQHRHSRCSTGVRGQFGN